MTTRVAILVALLLAVEAAEISAQTLRGKVVQPSDGLGVSGVLVLLIDSTGNVAARALTDERGEYRVVVTRPGAYKVRALRIGYHPTSLVTVELNARVTLDQQLEVTSRPLALDTLHVSRERCSSYEGSSIIASAWEQARTALAAAEITSNNRLLNATVLRSRRVLDPGSGRERGGLSTESSGFVTKPWGTVPPDSVRRFGYVYRRGDGSTTYYAPDIETLLSDDFLQDHCLRFASGLDSTLLGVAFEPTRARKNLPEITGTVWLDRKSAELRRMEFQYVNLKSLRGAGRVPPPGGVMSFGSMSNGGWAISNWELRIPVLRERVRPNRTPYEEPTETYLSELRVETGVLTLVRRGQDTLWRAK
jgi:hypothetical protein